MGRTLALRGVLWGAGGLSGSSDDDPVGSGASDDDPGSLGGLEGFRDRSERYPRVLGVFRGPYDDPTNKNERSGAIRLKTQKNDLLGGLRGSWGVLRGL
ncbi:hypothetical protein PGTUg99_037450 [Puccinia graminis f. sp. tritici]|uniref:Uncharacterized protein n=1 Tax=Puccinia graminis f. sp. tritici TaxID=56615 RepID=A0A5B0MHU8_PUCGR|nr:hypothetical protein PGTUg99_037450 [Puccinia graminis f. sp. tritici]